jgi:hypothetical protein
MKKFIVTTTINPPTIAYSKFTSLKEWTLIVVGDLKTPHKHYSASKDLIYLHPKDQEKMSKKLSDLIGWNCIQRRNFGYLLAYKMGADLIATVDDDNIPYNFWGKKIFINKSINVNYYKTKDIAFDPLSIFKFKQKLWHRGFPLQLLDSKKNFTKKKKKILFDIQANLWNQAPDIDAINRMNLFNENFIFKNIKPYSSNAFIPFNSQNTILSRKVIKNYFLFPHIGRMDDIWAAYYVQSLGYKVVFDNATVYQARNYHNIYDDFKKEIIGYKNNFELIVNLKKKSSFIKKFLPRKSYLAFKIYEKLFI